MARSAPTVGRSPSSAAALAIAALAVAAASPRGAPAPSRPRAGGIGEACLDCHAAIVRSYRESGMARALEPLRPGELAGLEPVDLPGTRWRYRYEDGELVESWRSEAGPPQLLRSAPVAFAIGAGLLDRSYAVVDARRLWFSPIEVLAADGEHGRRATLAPGHSIEPALRLDSPIQEACLACHTDALPPDAYPRNLVPDPAAWQPRGIGCGACHGDVAGHVEHRVAELEGRLPADAPPDPVLGLVHSGAVERLSVCARCHLQGDARFPLTRSGRPLVEPGGDLLDQVAVFVAAQPTDEIGFVSQTERTVRSRCFTASLDSERPLVCGTCHDPHRSILGADGETERARVRAGCFACHPGGGEVPPSPAAACAAPMERRAGRDCVACHMRLTPVYDLAQVQVHDHFVRVDPGPPSSYADLRLRESRDGRVRPFTWPGVEPPEHADDPALAMMAAIRTGDDERARALVDAPPGPRARRSASYHHLRAGLLEGLGRFDDARQSYLRALVLDPGAPESEVNLALVLGQLGRPQEGIERLDSVLAAHPEAEAALRNRAVLRIATGDVAGFVRDLEAAQAIFPRAENARALASVLDTRDPRAAARWRAEAQRLDPSAR